MLALCPLNLVLEFRKLSRHPAVLPPILLHLQSTQWPLTSTTTGPESRFRFPSKLNLFQAPLNAKPHVKWSPNPGTIDNKAHVTDHTHQQPMCLLVSQSPSLALAVKRVRVSNAKP